MRQVEPGACDSRLTEIIHIYMGRKPVVSSRRHRHQTYPHRAKQVIGYGLLILALAIGSKDIYYFDNGAGGSAWTIGEPYVSIINAHNPRSTTEASEFALELVNRDRHLNGLSPLVEDPLLTQTAQAHAEDMLTRQFYAHINPDGETPSDRFARIGGQSGAGENIVQWHPSPGTGRITFGTVERFERGWMYSDGHRANLLEPRYTRFGYGIVTNRNGSEMYAVQNFAP
jgi:uncharacterized protein YkwD